MWNRTGVAYLQVRPDPRYSGQLRAIKVTQKQPDVLEPGCVVIKLSIQMPDAAFQPLRPEATVVVPSEFVQYPVSVEAAEDDPR